MPPINKITLFVQCLVDGLYPEVGEALLTLFKRLNIQVDCPLDQTCCGQPAFNSGYWKSARMAAKKFIRTFQGAEWVVCPSGSCVSMVKHHYPELFKNDPAWARRAQDIGERTFELSQFLVDVLGVTDLGAVYQGKVTYHDSCHLLRTLGVREQPRQLIEHVKGSQFIEMRDPDRCCGFGGTFAVKYPQISTAMVDVKVRNIIESGADVVTGCDISCLMNIQGRLNRLGSTVKVLHLAQLLAGKT